MSKIIVVGAGMVGSAMALDLAKDHNVGIADISEFDLTEVAKGKLILRHSSELPEAHPDGYKMFSLRFKAKSGHPTADLQFDKASIRIKALNEIEMPFSTKDQLIDILQHTHIAGTRGINEGSQASRQGNLEPEPLWPGRLPLVGTRGRRMG